MSDENRNGEDSAIIRILKERWKRHGDDMSLLLNEVARLASEVEMTVLANDIFEKMKQDLESIKAAIEKNHKAKP